MLQTPLLCPTFSGIVVQVLDSVKRKGRLVQKTLAIVPNVIFIIIMIWKYGGRWAPSDDEDYAVRGFREDEVC